MQKRSLAVLAITVIVVAALAASVLTHRVPPSQPPLQNITLGPVQNLKTRFNAAQHQTRILLLLSPT